jgi:hypothetical protein
MSVFKQLIKQELATKITHLEKLKQEGKFYEKTYFEKSIPGTEEGAEAFAILNKIRKTMKKLDKRLTSLRKAQKLLKDIPDVMFATVDDPMILQRWEEMESEPVYFQMIDIDQHNSFDSITKQLTKK